jgi:L-rhamnose 1-dehydrogenase
MVRRIHSGAIGKIVTAESCFYYGGARRQPPQGASPAEARLRTWTGDRILSGDIIVEQNVHSIDKLNWVLQGHPVAAVACGGRAARDDYGDVWDHSNALLHYPNNVTVSFRSAQFLKGWTSVTERFFGTAGSIESHYDGPVRIHGEQPWDGGVIGTRAGAEAYKVREFFNDIRTGNLRNEGRRGAASTLSAMLIRSAAYARREVTWEGMVSSGQRWDRSAHRSRRTGLRREYAMRLSEKVAIVTGAGTRRGIGRAIALAFAREGADVAVTEWEDENTSEEIRMLGQRSLGVAVDVADSAAVRSFVAEVERTLGPVDILVNNAGFCEFAPFLEISDALWDRTMEVNLRGYFVFSQEVARRMAARDASGAILNISSQAAEMAGEEKVHYCVSKAGVRMLTQGMALELARRGIRVNAIAPGTIDTDIVRQEHILALVERERAHSTIPLGRMGTPEDLVEAAIFLCSPAAGYITGATLLIDGGMLAGFSLPEEFRSAAWKAGSR